VSAPFSSTKFTKSGCEEAGLDSCAAPMLLSLQTVAAPLNSNVQSDSNLEKSVALFADKSKLPSLSS